jgi:hypothetical protein
VACVAVGFIPRRGDLTERLKRRQPHSLYPHFFIPQHLGINSDTRELVVPAPSLVQLIRAGLPECAGATSEQFIALRRTSFPIKESPVGVRDAR